MKRNVFVILVGLILLVFLAGCEIPSVVITTTTIPVSNETTTISVSNETTTTTTELQEYTVSFNSNGGSSFSSVTDVTSGSTIGLPVPTKTGYDFIGWYLGDSANEMHFTSSDKVYNDLSLYAKWEAKEYIIKFFDFSGDLIYVETVNYFNSAHAPYLESVEGYTFAGWDLDFIEVTSDMNIYSVYFIQIFDVYFDSNGGTSVNDLYDIPYSTTMDFTMPEKLGYDFLGWSYNGEYYNRYSHITEDLYLEALWIEDTNLVFELIDGGTYEVINYKDFDSLPLDIVIPDFYNGLPVTSLNIDLNEEQENEYTQSIYLPAYLSYINKESLCEMRNLENIYVSEDNEHYTVLDNVLYTKDMKTLLTYAPQKPGSTFTIPESVERLGSNAFGCNKFIEVINISKNLKYIGDNPFYDSVQISVINVDTDNLYFTNYEGVLFNKELTKLYFYPYQREGSEYIVPSTVTELASWAFVFNYNIESIVLPEGLTTIGAFAFKLNHNLRSLNIPSTVVNMESQVFNYNTFFITLTIYTNLLSEPTSWDDGWNQGDVSVVWGYIETIDDGELIYATSTLHEVSIIGLSDTASSTDIYIPATIDGDEVVQIVSAAFQLTNITSIHIPNTLKIIGPNALAECHNLTTVIFEETSTLEKICMNAFSQSSNLMSLIIPLSVDYMGYKSLGLIGEGAVVYAEVSHQPTGWNSDWRWFNGTVIFGYLGTYDNGDFVYAINTFDEVYIISQSPSSTDTYVVIPKIIDGKPVVSVASNAFRDNQLITKVFIPNTIEAINCYTFKNAINLKTIIFEEDSNIRFIYNSAFYNCNGLTEFVIPEGVEKIKYDAFYSCDNLIKVMLPNTIIDLETSLIKTLTYTTIYVALPSQPATWNSDWNKYNYAVVWNYTGYYQSTIEFESNGETIINSITQDEGTAVVEPTEPTREGFAFLGWYTEPEFSTEYTFTVIPKNDITLYAKWQALISTITFDTDSGTAVSPITQTVGTIIDPVLPPTKAGYTYNGWFTDPELSNQYIFTVMPESDLTLYVKWILNTSTINFDSSGGTFVDAITQAEGSAVTAPTDPTKTDSIFDDWYIEPEFTNLYVFDTIPIDDITLYAKWIVPYQVIEEGMTYSIMGDVATLISFSGSATEIVIPKTLSGGATVTAIGEDAFAGSGIESVFIPNTVISIGKAAFHYVSSLETVEFESDSQLEFIGNEAFSLNYDITSFVIPDTVEHIGNDAFSSCANLKYIVIPISVTNIGENAFNDCKYTTIFIRVSAPVSTWDANWNPDDLDVFYGYIEIVDDDDFVYATSTHNEATLIGLSASNTDTVIVIPNSFGIYVVTDIIMNAFRENTQITSITIPIGVTEIKRSTFDGASNLTTVLFASGSQLEVIGRSAFAKCVSLSAIVFPDSLTTIEYEAFYDAKGLSTIIIPLNVLTIESSAFIYTGLTIIHIVASDIPDGWHSNWNPDNITFDLGYTG